MSTQNLNIGPMRSSGHKDVTEDHVTVAKIKTQVGRVRCAPTLADLERGDNGDPEALLQNRILNNGQVSRAALYDNADFLCVASSQERFDLEPDNVRKVLDGLLTYSRVGDPTWAGGDGEPPKNLHLGNEGKAVVKDGDGERVIAELKGKTLIAARTATHVLLVEGTESANEGSLATIVQSFQEGLQVLTM